MFQMKNLNLETQKECLLGSSAIINRISFTGELGYEIYVTPVN